MPADPNRVRDVFLAAVELSLEQRPAYLAEACGGDADLRAEVDPAVGVEAPGRQAIRVEVGSPWAIAALLRPFRPGVVDEDPTHGLGRGGEEVPSAVELLIPDQPQVGFVNQGGRVEGVAGGFGRHARGGELPQLVIDERQQLGGGPAVASLGGTQELRELGHWGSSLPAATISIAPPAAED